MDNRLARRHNWHAALLGLVVFTCVGLAFTFSSGPHVGGISFAFAAKDNGPGQATTITEYALPQVQSYPYDIVTGSDGALWFTEYVTAKIGRISLQGNISEFNVPTASSAPAGLTVGPDGAIWFTEMDYNNGNKIGRLTSAGEFTEYTLPTPHMMPEGIVLGSDGALWFTEYWGGIGRITTNGTITEYPLPPTSYDIASIAVGGDGALWFTEAGLHYSRIGRITTSGVVSEFPLSDPDSSPYGITAGPDGALWFTEWNTSKIGRITTGGTISEFALPNQGSSPDRITVGPDGALWFTEFDGNRIGRITTAGEITEYAIPTVSSVPIGLTEGSDGAIWFVEANADKIGRLDLGPAETPTSTSTPVSTLTSTAVATTGESTSTRTPSTTATATRPPTITPVPPTSTSTSAPTSTPVVFPDVPPGSPFYPFVECLAGRGIISGYPNGTFGPGNPVTRGQLSKIVSNSANYTETFSTNTFEDVAVGSTFFPYVERLYLHGGIAGYACGGAGEPCIPPANKPYFRPGANVTRGQTSKIVAIAKGLPAPSPGQQTFEDVPPNSTFWTWIEPLAATGAIGGYPCGGVGEPCNPPTNRPYFRPGANVTRGQSAKIVSNAFFPGCTTLARR